MTNKTVDIVIFNLLNTPTWDEQTVVRDSQAPHELQATMAAPRRKGEHLWDRILKARRSSAQCEPGNGLYIT